MREARNHGRTCQRAKLRARRAADAQHQQNISKVPWLGDIPILGALFRSNKFQNNETELVVIVTPYLVQPPAIAAAHPTDGFEAPHDAQQVLFGDTWRRGLPAPARGPLNAGSSGLIGPAGFRLD